ncbi:ATP-binding cassette domain-containing protein [Aminivibrio sp.]|uniref:ATP-binding cassette domain-containing protein n=1 Tax=Aminivibrio sp. TaxID=1872489 RepID=UPI003D985C2C
MSESLLQFKNVSKNYYGNRVLTDINFDVKRGEIHALIGENGAGKSTLMNILFGMPVITSTGGYEGDVLIDGKVINFKSPTRLCMPVSEWFTRSSCLFRAIQLRKTSK